MTELQWCVHMQCVCLRMYACDSCALVWVSLCVRLHACMCVCERKCVYVCVHYVRALCDCVHGVFIGRFEHVHGWQDWCMETCCSSASICPWR